MMDVEAAVKLGLTFLAGRFDFRVVRIRRGLGIEQGYFIQVNEKLIDLVLSSSEYYIQEYRIGVHDPDDIYPIKHKQIVNAFNAEIISKLWDQVGEPFTIILKEETLTDKQIKLHNTYLEMAKTWGNMSYCVRKKVGCLVVKDKMIISDGYNGMPSKFPNVCELEDGETDKRVLHAEANAITKLAKSTNSGVGSSLYVTLSPCMECSKLLVQTEIKEIIFSRLYSDALGLVLLLDAGISIYYIP